VQSIQQKNYAQAIIQLKQALEINPNSIEAYYNLAYVLKLQGHMHETLPLYDLVLSKRPDHLYAHLGNAQACLATGNYIKGWEEFEWRMGSPQNYIQEFKNYVQSNKPLKNKIVLLRAEWGIGDTIQMLRYAKILKDHGAIIKIQPIHHALVPLLQQQKYLDEVISPEDSLPLSHFQVPMVSFPYVFQTRIETLPAEIPYIHINGERRLKWKEKLSQDTKYKIGICWKGNTIHSEEKFMPLSYFAQLAKIPGVSLYSLQKIHGLDQIAQLEDPSIIKTFDASFDAVPFLDTAAVMHNLNLVITVDTSLAHLAGALGIDVWVILPYPAEWRWMLDRADSPWYPTMRLFRKKSQGTWQKVIDNIIHALQQEILCTRLKKR
jgi:tetratricopeptide (TPR) repeat protein